MSDKDKGPQADAARKRRRARRPATIDLSATEVTEAAAEEKVASAEMDKDAPDRGKDRAREKPGAQTEAAKTPAERKAGDKSAPASKPDDKKPAPDKKPEEKKPAEAGRDRTASKPASQDKTSSKAAPRRRGGWPLFAGGAVAGGLIALGLYAGLAQLGLAPGLGGNVSRLDVRVGNLEMRLAELRSSIPDTGDLSRAPEVAALAARLDALEERPVPDERGDPQAIREELAGLAARLAEAEELARAARDDVDALTARLAASGEDSQSSAAAGAALGERLSAAEQAAARAGEQAAAASRAAETARAALRTRLLQDIDARDTAFAGRLDALESEVSALGEKVAAGDSVPRLQAQAALAIAVAGLERAVASGEPFARELQVVASLAGAESTEIAALREVAESGVARPEELAEAFPGVARAILDAGGEAGDRTLITRLMDNARSLVRVRPTGEVAGDSRAAIVARMEARLSAGDLAGALDEAGALDAPARVAAADWLARAQASVRARSQARSLAEQVAAGLGKADGVAPK